MSFASIPDALVALRAGRPVLVLDDEDRENEGDVVLAAETLTDEWLAWTIRHTSGYICAPLTEAAADRLGLPLMVKDNADPLRTAYTVTVDAASGRHDRHLRRGPGAHDPAPSPTPGHRPATSSGPATSFRSGRATAVCSSGPGTPRRPSTCAGWPASRRSGPSARSSRTTAG